MTIENPYSSPQAPASDHQGPELIYKPELTDGQRQGAVVLNLLFFGAPGYFIIGQPAKGVLMGIATLLSWVVGLGLIPTIAAAIDVNKLGKRLQAGEGIRTWESFSKNEAPDSDRPADGKIYRPQMNGLRILLAGLANFMLLGAPGYWMVGQYAKSFVFLALSGALWCAGLGFLPALFATIDVISLAMKQSRGEGIEDWQFF